MLDFILSSHQRSKTGLNYCPPGPEDSNENASFVISLYCLFVFSSSIFHFMGFVETLISDENPLVFQE